jgi:ubiquinone/menaquinone biosynthesis C-methylase UbiE
VSIRKRLFAWILKKGESINDQIYRSYKQNLFSTMNGKVVEIGPGTGINFRYMPTGTEWVGVEPNPSFHTGLIAQAEVYGIHAKLVAGEASKIPIPDDTADIVLCTLVLCSVPDPDADVTEMKRILKPGGKLMFIEHVAAPARSTLRKIQNFSNPFNRLMADGCNCNRETWLNIEKGAFKKIILSHHRVRGGMALHSPHIMGYAIK